MRDTYSLYEAKAKLSAILRRVSEGHRVTVTVRGVPVAEIRPIAPDTGGLGARMEQFAQRRILVRPESRPASLERVVRRPGALARFLADRGDG